MVFFPISSTVCSGESFSSAVGKPVGETVGIESGAAEGLGVTDTKLSSGTLVGVGVNTSSFLLDCLCAVGSGVGMSVGEAEVKIFRGVETVNFNP